MPVLIIILLNPAFSQNTLSLNSKTEIGQFSLQFQKIKNSPTLLTPEISIIEADSVIIHRTDNLFEPKYEPITPQISTKKFNENRTKKTKLNFSSQPLFPSKTKIAPDFIFKDISQRNIKYTDKIHGFFTNLVIDIVQDNQSKEIWISSQTDGLCKLDGNTMKVYTVKSGLPSNAVNKIFFDSQNRLWLLTNKGLCYIKNDSLFTVKNKDINFRYVVVTESDNGRLFMGSYDKGFVAISSDLKEYLTISTENYLPSNEISSILCDKNDNLWFGLQHYTVVKFDDNQFTFYKFYENDNIDICTGIFQNDNGIWFGFFDRPIVNFKNGKFYKFHFSENRTPRVYGFTENKQGMWIADYNSGLYFIDKKLNKVKHFKEEDGIVENGLFFLHTDSFNNVWVGTIANGVFRIDNQMFEPYDKLKITGLRKITKAIRNQKNEIWYTPNGGYLTKEEEKKITFYTYKNTDITPITRHIWSADFINPNELWLGSYSMGIWKFNKKKFTKYLFEKGNFIFDVKTVNDSTAWFATWLNGLKKY